MILRRDSWDPEGIGVGRSEWDIEKGRVIMGKGCWGTRNQCGALGRGGRESGKDVPWPLLVNGQQYPFPTAQRCTLVVFADLTHGCRNRGVFLSIRP